MNGSAQTTGILGDADDRSAGTLVINADDMELTAGNTYTVEFSSEDFNALGYQFTMNFDKAAVEFVEVGTGLAADENFGMALLDEGAITTSWNGQATSDDLFSLTFRAITDAQLSDVVSVSSQYTVAEAYNQNGDAMNVSLEFTGGTVANAGFELYQNTPNPFRNETVIGFNLVEGGAATLLSLIHI